MRYRALGRPTDICRGKQSAWGWALLLKRVLKSHSVACPASFNWLYPLSTYSIVGTRSFCWPPSRPRGGFLSSVRILTCFPWHAGPPLPVQHAGQQLFPAQPSTVTLSWHVFLSNPRLCAGSPVKSAPWAPVTSKEKGWWIQQWQNTHTHICWSMWAHIYMNTHTHSWL